MNLDQLLEIMPTFLKDYHAVDVVHLCDRFTSALRKDVREWVQENVDGDTYRCGGFLFFENAQDALYFKLRWCGE